MSTPVRDELATLDATAQAELVRSGELTSLELVEAAIARIEAVDPELNAVIHRFFEEAREEAARRAARRALPRRPVPAQGPRRLVRRPAASHGDAAAQGDRLPRARRLATSRSRFRDAGLVTVGKTNTPEIGILPTTEPDRLRPDSQSLGHLALGRRLERRLRRRGGRRPGPVRARLRRRRLDPHPGEPRGLVGLKTTRAAGAPGRSPATSPRASRRTSRSTRSVRDAAALLDAVARPGAGRSLRGAGSRSAPTPRSSTPIRASCGSR